MKKLLIVIIFFSLFLSSCVIGALQSGFPLNPPLGLQLRQEGMNIVAKWWGNNPENYFSGYVVFISTNPSDLYNNPNDTNHFDKPYMTNSFGELPTVPAPISSITKEFSYTISYLPDGSTLMANVTYYISVASYSASKRTFSPLSNIEEIVLTN